MFSNLILVQQQSSLPQDFSLVLGASWTSQRQVLHHWKWKQRSHWVVQPLPRYCNQLSISIQQQPRIFPSLPFIDDKPEESLLVALHVPWQIQFQVGFVFNPIPAYLDHVSIFLLGLLHLSLLPTFLCFLLHVWVLSGAPCSSMQASCHLCLISCVLGWIVSLKKQPGCPPPSTRMVNPSVWETKQGSH